MSAIGEIEDAIRRLSSGELAEFRTWFAEFDGALWDRQIQEDVAAGRLDALADEALSDLREGRCTDRRKHRSFPRFRRCYISAS